MPASPQRKVRVGMIGGGPGAFIGGSHRIAMRLDDRYQLVAGVFSRNRDKSLAAARELGISEDRVYPDYETMAAREPEREDGVDAVAIVTPTDSHYKIAKKLLEAGLNVICDKPLCLSVVEARELQALAEKGELILCLTHNYSGYAMVRHAARLVRNGDLGEVKMVQVEHASGWAAKLLEKQGHTQAAWRMDPTLGGEASVLYDLGTHAHQLARFITGLEVSEVAAELSKVVAGREINDNANVLLRFTNGRSREPLGIDGRSRQRTRTSYSCLWRTRQPLLASRGPSPSALLPDRRPPTDSRARRRMAFPRCRQMDPCGSWASGGLFRSVRQPLHRGCRRLARQSRRAASRESRVGISRRLRWPERGSLCRGSDALLCGWGRMDRVRKQLKN
jgi:predicted dehydrogenase